jgi:hypothetical protein
MSKETLKLALEALNVAEHFVEEYAASKYYFAHIAAKTALKEALAKQSDSLEKPYAHEAAMYSNDRMTVDPQTGSVSIGTAKQEQGEPLPDFYITERTADSIYKLKSRDWALCISGNKGPTMHKNIPVFVGYVKTKPVEQEPVAEPHKSVSVGEPVAWVQDVEYEQSPEFAFSWVETRLHTTPLYTTPYVATGRQQRPSRSDIKPLTDEQIERLNLTAATKSDVRDIEAAHGIKE